MTPERRIRKIITTMFIIETKSTVNLCFTDGAISVVYDKDNSTLYINQLIYNIFEMEFDMCSADIKELIKNAFNDYIKVSGVINRFRKIFVKIEF
jgi:hypothetical protein